MQGLWAITLSFAAHPVCVGEVRPDVVVLRCDRTQMIAYSDSYVENSAVETQGNTLSIPHRHSGKSRDRCCHPGRRFVAFRNRLELPVFLVRPG